MPVVLKLGGSLITYKDRPLTAREEVIRMVAEEISRAWREGVREVFLVHGGGSYGHYIASRVVREKKEIDVMGFTEIAWYMNELNRIVVRHLIEMGVPAVQFPTRAFVHIVGGGLVVYREPLERAIERGVVPVAFGDVVLSDRGFEIVSGDHLAWRVAVELGAERVLFASSVDGVYERPPEKGGGRLLERVSVSRLEGVVVEGSPYIDVTGGMYTKIFSGIEALRRGVRGLVFNGSVPGNVYRALTGQSVLGTVIEY